MINKKIQDKFINDINSYSIDYNFQRFGVYYSYAIDEYITIANHIGKIEYNPWSSKFHYEERDKQYFNFCYNLINMFYISALWAKYYG